MSSDFPQPDQKYPRPLPSGEPNTGVVFLKNMIEHRCVSIGDYTYAASFNPPDDWLRRLAPYLHDFSRESLVIGKFCQIADGVSFLTSSANHRYDGFSSYPFAAIAPGQGPDAPSLPNVHKDTVIGNDVWLGQNAIVLPGAQIGDGVIVGAGAVVGGTIPPYSVVVGNPGRVLRKRATDAVIDRLLALAWWDWPIEVIVANEEAICGTDIDKLETVAPTV